MATVAKLFDERQIAARVQELAAAIADAVSGDFTILAVLKGSFVFVADLARALAEVGLSPRIEFVQLSSYGAGTETSGEVRLVGTMPELAGRSVLLVDDIADTGLSFTRARQLLADRGAGPIWTCALVDKPSRRRVEFAPDFVGFRIEDVFIVGYGIDYAEDYRYLPYIGILEA